MENKVDSTYRIPVKSFIPYRYMPYKKNEYSDLSWQFFLSLGAFVVRIICNPILLKGSIRPQSESF